MRTISPVHVGVGDEKDRLQYVVIPEDFNAQRGSSTLVKAVKDHLRGEGASLIFYDACYGCTGAGAPDWDIGATVDDYQSVVELATKWICHPAGTVLVVWPGKEDQLATCLKVMQDAGLQPFRLSWNKGQVKGNLGNHVQYTDEVILVGHTPDHSGKRDYFWERFKPQFRDNVLYCPPVHHKVRASFTACRVKHHVSTATCLCAFERAAANCMPRFVLVGCKRRCSIPRGGRTPTRSRSCCTSTWWRCLACRRRPSWTWALALALWLPLCWAARTR